MILIFLKNSVSHNSPIWRGFFIFWGMIVGLGLFAGFVKVLVQTGVKQEEKT